uniref:Uncharacterized protein n=1 Tax=Setaria viridis TaxID=4556 RepID=A0A4V6D963_SETVI|nr:hypothetical protein SEVIR_3G069300v2 [Setaria viridis]
MSEAGRAAEAERLRQEALEEARRLKTAGDLDGGRWREGEARILDLDPKQQSGIYSNRCSAVDLATFDHDEECNALWSDEIYGCGLPQRPDGQALWGQ